MAFYLQLMTVLLALIIAFLQTIVFPGVAESIPIVKKLYMKARKGFGRLYKIDRSFKTVDKKGEEVFVPASF